MGEKNHKKAAVQPIIQILSNAQWNLERQNKFFKEITTNECGGAEQQEPEFVHQGAP